MKYGCCLFHLLTLTFLLKHLLSSRWQNKHIKKKNYRNIFGKLSCKTHKNMSFWHWGKHEKANSFLSRACQQIHYYHTQTKSHTQSRGKTMHALACQCLPGDQRELWMLKSLPTLHVCESPQNTSHCCPSFWLPSMTPQPQTSKRPIAPSPPTSTHPPPRSTSPARWLFFNCLWAPAPLLYHTKSLRWQGGAEGFGAVHGQMVRR